MKYLLVALDSQYIHSNLAVRYLKSSCSDLDCNVEIVEYTINDVIENVISDIYLRKPGGICFSCYIWNIRMVLKIAATLKKILPDSFILLGGPEVSYDAANIMKLHDEVDYIIKGEGERAFRSLIQQKIEHCYAPSDIFGLVYRNDNKIIENNEFNIIDNMNELPDPYKYGFSELKNRIVYYESSRGCPYNCQYCLSSTLKGVRFLDVGRVKKDIDRFIDNGVKQVKFVDRTFNADPSRADEIFSYVINKDCNTNFHFEIAAHLLNDKTLNILKSAPKGRIQLEIGIQSTNSETINEIKRKTDFERIKHAVITLEKAKNINVHVDLIAGLPGEDSESFRKSFNDTFALKADKLQLGFLKMLKGCGLRYNAGKYGYSYTDYPPYEVLKNDSISFDDLTVLKHIETLVEKYYNSGRFKYSLDYITTNIEPYEFFRLFSEYWASNGYDKMGISAIKSIDILYKFGIDELRLSADILSQFIKFDYLIIMKQSQFPDWMINETDSDKEKIREFYRQKICNVLSSLNKLNSKQYWRVTDIKKFNVDLIEYMKSGRIKTGKYYILFDYFTHQSPVIIDI